MATGSNIQPGRGINVSNLPPVVNLNDGSAEAWDAVRRIGDQFREAGKPDLIRRAQARGQAEGAAIAAGEQEYRPPSFAFGDVAAARAQAVETAYVAGVRTDIDAREAELRQQYRYDPQGYQTAAREMVSGFIQGAPPDFAVDVETYANTLTQRGFEVVGNARVQRDEAETTQAIGVRRAQLTERLIAMASRPGGIEDAADYSATMMEYNALQDTSEANPALLYSPEQRAKDDESLSVGIAAGIVGVEAVRTYTASGGGSPGFAAASRMLRERVLEGEEFEQLKPEVRARLYRDSVSQITAYAQADREERRAEDEANRARREAQRDRKESYALRIALGDLPTAAEVQADTMLDDGDRATLIRSRDAAQRREAEQARRDDALERQASRDTYNGYRDQAMAGTLTPQEIADGVAAGQISRGQGRTLQGLTDRSLAPVIQDVLAPVRDAGNRPGRTGRGTATIMAQAEEAAARVARSNPDMTIDQRLAAGRAIAESLYGAPGAGRPTTPQAAANDQTQRLSVLAQERQRRAADGRPMSTAEYNRRRNEIIHGR